MLVCAICPFRVQWRILWCGLTRGCLVMTEVSQSKSRFLKTTTANMLVFLYSFEEWGAPSGYVRRMVVLEPTSLSKPCTGALFSLVTQMELVRWQPSQRLKNRRHSLSLVSTWHRNAYLIMMSYWSICDPRWLPWRIPPLPTTTHRVQLPSLFNDGGRPGWGRVASATARCCSMPWNPRGGDRLHGSCLSCCTNTGMSWRPTGQDRCLRWFRHQRGRQGPASREAVRFSTAWTEGKTFKLKERERNHLKYLPRCTKMHLYHIFGLLIVVSDSCHLVRGEISRNQNSQITSDQQHQAKEKVLLSLQQIVFF